MKIVISSFGSSGDFNPCLGLARALKQKGVDVIFLSNPYHEKIITDAGLRFAPAGDYWDVAKEIREKPAYLHPRKGPRAVWDLVVRVVPIMHSAMVELLEKETPDMVASHILEYGGMIAAIEANIPYTLLSPTPMGWFSADPPGYLNFPELPHWLRRLQARGLRRLMGVALKYSLKPSCRKQGIACPFNSIDDIYSKAALNLGLWSTLLKDYTPGDPPNAKICGFVRDEHIRHWANVPDEITRLFNAPKKPVVVGLGSTASLHGEAIYRRTAEICKQLDQPCLLVGADLGKFADPERAVQAVDFAPYGWVFPRASMVIHHGGLNTTAETLRAGAPSLVIPHAHDQFDNAIRTGHMGLSKRLKPAQIASPVFPSTLQSILHDAEMHKKSKAFAAQLQSQPDGADIAAEYIMQKIQ